MNVGWHAGLVGAADHSVGRVEAGRRGQGGKVCWGCEGGCRRSRWIDVQCSTTGAVLDGGAGGASAEAPWRALVQRTRDPAVHPRTNLEGGADRCIPIGNKSTTDTIGILVHAGARTDQLHWLPSTPPSERCSETASESCKLAQKLQPDWEQMDGRERRKKEQEAEIDTKRRAMLAGTGRNTDSVRAPVPLHRPFPAKR